MAGGVPGSGRDARRHEREHELPDPGDEGRLRRHTLPARITKYST